MSEDKEKRSRLIFRIYLFILALIAIGLFFGPIPYDLGQDILKLPQGNLITSSPELDHLISFVTFAYLGFSLLMTGIGALVSIGTRDVLEVIALFLAAMLPKERKYWGVVFDQKSGHPLAFVPIRVFKYSEGKGTLVHETVTDTDGRYRMRINDESGSKYTIEVHYPGYEPLVSDVDQYLVIGNYDLVSDIPLQAAQTSSDKLKARWYALRPRVYRYLFFTIYGLSVFMIPVMVWFTLNDPLFGNFFATGMFIVSAWWNTGIVRERARPLIGKVLDVEVDKPLSKAIVNVYNKDGDAVTALSDEEGVVRLSIPSGIYRSIVTAAGYVMLGRDSQGFRIVKVGKDGYIDKNVPMKKHDMPVVGAASAAPVPAAAPAEVSAPVPVPAVVPAPTQMATSVPAATPIVPAVPVTPEPKPDEGSLLNPFN